MSTRLSVRSTAQPVCTLVPAPDVERMRVPLAGIEMAKDDPVSVPSVRLMGLPVSDQNFKVALMDEVDVF
jgi:hypothetical protein